MKKAVIVFSKLLISLILIVTFLMGLVYVQTRIYNFPPPTPFSGDSLINPYQNINNKSFKCNFHAHSKAWGGVTNGHNSSQEITTAYKDKGYTVAGISNYHKIEDSINSNSPIYIPVYEHGINIKKSHLLGIDADKPSYFDFPLWQNTSQKQQIINDVRNNNGLVTIAHPKFMDGHTLEDMARLTNYQFVEVLNHYRISDEYWDAALTAGRLVYGIGNDDTHDINNEPTFRMWTEVYADVPTKDGILNSMVAGKSYMVHAKEGIVDLAPVMVMAKGDSLSFEIKGPVLALEVWGANHELLLSSPFEQMKEYPEGATYKCLLKLPKNKPYARLVAKSANCTLYLNPIVRSVNGKTKGVERLVPELNVTKTWFYRLFVLLIEALVLLLFLYICPSERIKRFIRAGQLKPFKR
jgi:hypothetical protein